MSKAIMSNNYFNEMLYEKNFTNRSGVKESLRSFQDEMHRMIREYTDPESSITIGSMIVPPEAKDTAATTLLLDDRIAKIDQASSMLMRIYMTMVDLEKNFSAKV